MAEAKFAYLTGLVRVPAKAPMEWADEGLGAFYRHPNDDAWGRELCRVLYHESVHFWQLLASSYLANLVAAEWHRLTAFERSGAILPRAPAVAGFLTGEPFSPSELTECWARYWDVHTRSPAAIIGEDLVLSAKKDSEAPLATSLGGRPAYSNYAFDLVMQEGSESRVYAAPYRWMLEKTGADSYLVAVAFPIICHSAFMTRDPVAVFAHAFETVAADGPVRRWIAEHRSGNINLDWLNQWSFVIGEAVIPAIRKLELPSFTSGITVISKSPALRNHPTLPPYVRAARLLWSAVTAAALRARDPRSELAENDELDVSALNDLVESMESFDQRFEQFALFDLASQNLFAVFGLPGQPDYRMLLGRFASPPIVCFENFTLEAVPMRPHSSRRLSAASGTVHADQVAMRVRRFRAAERAVALGLPADAFERPAETILG